MTICKPRASGDDPSSRSFSFFLRPVNPARAGMIPISCRSRAPTDSKPRASGDDPRISYPQAVALA